MQMLPNPTSENGLAHYMREIQRYPLLAAEEEAELDRRWRGQADEAAVEQLVGSHLRLVVKLASQDNRTVAIT